MKNFSPLTIWNWFKKRPKWQKYFLFIFIIAIIILAFIKCSLLDLVLSRHDIARIAKDNLESGSKEETKNTLSKDAKLKEDIKKELKKREKNKKEREKNYENSKDIHDKIDTADTIDELANISTYDDGRR